MRIHSTGIQLLVLLNTTRVSAFEEARDSDRDGLSDELEKDTGTDPFDRDTDSDGVADGKEDTNRDGVHDSGETNPRRAGLFPGTFPHIPEPLVFDLVRGLGARRGELEVNTLGVMSVDTGAFHWAPEIEWAFWDGQAIELELPLRGRHLEAVKVALQSTLPAPWRRFTHGVQAFAEVGLDAGATDAVLLYLAGQRLGTRWSYLSMVGGSAMFDGGSVESPSAIFNLSFFYDVIEWSTFGLETNSRQLGAEGWLFRLFPQVHVQLSRRLRVQLSGGVEVRDGPAGPLGALRVILE